MRKKKSRGRVPVILQMEALECGAASLCMVLAYYKKWIPLEQVRRDCGVSRDGSNAKNIIRAARSYGMEAKAYRCHYFDTYRVVPQFEFGYGLSYTTFTYSDIKMKPVWKDSDI